MQNTFQVLGLSNDIIAPLERPLGPVKQKHNAGPLGRLLQMLGMNCKVQPSASRYAIKISKPKFGEVFLAIMVLGYSVSAWNALAETEQRQLLDFLRQMPASHPDAKAIDQRYALLQASGLIAMPKARV
jgi:hypothetical protein